MRRGGFWARGGIPVPPARWRKRHSGDASEPDSQRRSDPDAKGCPDRPSGRCETATAAPSAETSPADQETSHPRRQERTDIDG
jgi:hypothetical protein